MRSALVLVFLVCLGGTAHAGRSFFGWLVGSEVMPERGVELQTWIWEEDGQGPTNSKETWMNWATHVGITDQLELVIPIEALWFTSDEGKTFSTFKRYGIEARYRFVSPDPVDAPALVPLLRLAVKRDIQVRNDTRVEADFVLSYETGAVQVLLDAGATADITPDNQHYELHPGLGVSVKAIGDLRLGAEVFAEIVVGETGASQESWAAVGPNLSWTHGRFWLSAMAGIGVYHIDTAPRVQWGIAF